MITWTSDLLAAVVGCSRSRAETFAGYLEEACEAYEITTPARLAAFLAQNGHESGGLQYVREIASGEAYEGRKDLGNIQPGDGTRYRGRGLIQTTGRSNYDRVRDRLRAKRGPEVPDFEAYPEELERPKWAAWSAADYWDMRGLNAYADRGDFESITRRINGGLNGQADRLKRWEKAKAVLMLAADPKPDPAVSQFTPAGEAGPQEAPMAPFLAAVLPSIVSAVPRLIETFGSGSEVSQRNQRAAEMVASIAKDALGAVNEQEVATRLQTDPEAPAIVRKAVESRWFEVQEAGGGGIDGARKAALEYSQPDGPRFWLNPAFWISVVLLAMPLMLLVDVFYVNPGAYVGEIRTQIVTGVLLIISMVGGYWIGTSFSSAKKDERTAR